MDAILAYAQSKQNDIIALLREYVECESPSEDPAAIERFAKIFERSVADIASVRRINSETHGPHLQAEFDLPARRKSGQILVLGHSDTVYPKGTIQRMPFRESDGRLWGPGVLDMKGGLAFFVFAMRALRALNLPVEHRVLLQLNSDEEVGSDSSRALTENEARRSTAVLVVEPGTGLEGRAKTARKGIGGYTLTVRGKAAHAGIDFTAGASAVLELARQVDRISGFTDLDRGITVNPGVIAGGTRVNVVAEHASAEIDFRVSRMTDAEVIDRKFRGLTPFDDRCTLEITGGLNRPPMELTPGIAALFRKAQALARELGVELDQSSTGGGSDGNFTAALGVPTLDGIGAVGEGAHSPDESILIDRIADRTALLAKLVHAL
jgi:glutamate carboxypeptidase